MDNNKNKKNPILLVWYAVVNAHVEKNTWDKQKEMWSKVGMNITTHKKKLSQQDNTCLRTSVTCLCLSLCHYSDACFKKQIRT